MREYLESTIVIDSDRFSICKCAKLLTMDQGCDTSRAVRLYYFVRDEIRYDPYTHFHKSEYYKASRTLRVRRGNCICKAILLCALVRSVGIPSRLGFANVRNHLATKQLVDFIGSDTFIFHGYTELFLNDKWVIATPAFNASLCSRFKVDPLEFDGYYNSIFQTYNAESKLYMEYVTHHGSFSDLPLSQILTAWKKGYGEKRVNGWIKELEESDMLGSRDFYKEDVL